MQSGRSATESVKEAAADAAASAKAGTEKAKATTKEKAERVTTSDPEEKKAVTRKKEERKTQAQLNKEEVHSHNEEARRVAEAGGRHPGYKTWGSEGYTTSGVAGTASTKDTEDYSPPAVTGGTGDDATIPTGHAAADSLHPKGPVRGDAPRFT